MSSPLSWFRKNQKIMLGVCGVGLMFVFTISLGSGVDPIIDRLSGRSSAGPANQTVVKWDGGKLNDNQLDRLRTQRNLLRRFLGGVMQTARERGGQQRVSMLPLYSGDQSLLELEMLAGEADKLGMTVNDETVIDYLNQLTDGTIRPSEYGQILRDTTANHLPEGALFPLLGREIKAQKVRGLVQSGSYPASPVAAWDYYNRLNRFVKAEIMPIMVDDYLGEVEQPTESEVVALFEKYKDQYPHPLSPNPGFRQRERRAFQYVKVSYDAILEAEKAAVTDEEIQKYYDDNKEQYLTQSEDDLTLDVGETESSESEKRADDEGSEPEDTTSTEETPNPAADDPGQAAEFDAAQSEAAQSEAAQSEAAQSEATESPADTSESTLSDEDPTTTNESAEETTEGESDDLDPTPSPTALPQDSEETPPQPSSDVSGDESTTEKTEAEPQSLAAATADAATEAATSAVETTGDAQPAAEQPIAEITEDADIAVDDLTAVETTAETPADERLDVSDLDIETYRPLSEVANEIRQSIAAPIAQTKMKQLLDEVQREMDKLWKDHTLWEMDFESGLKTKDDEPQPDLSGVVDGKQAVMGQVELTDRIDIENYEIGQAFDISISQQGGVQRVMFADVAYDPSMSIFKPQLFPTLDMATDRFVFWLTDSEDEYIPTLEQVRSQVVEAWQRQQALKIAEEEAKRMVAKARQAATRLQDCLADDKHTQFIDTGEISWVTAPMQEGATPQISQITGAEDAGEDLREELFHLPPGGVSYAPNMPKNKVYVFRVEEETPPLEIRREQFLRNGVGAPVLFLARRDSLVSLSEWYRELTDRYNVDWQRDPQRGDGGEM